MDILGIGPLEVIFILIIALVIFGPNDLVEAGRSTGRFFRKIVTSSEWSTLQKASREVRNLPNRLMREAGIEEFENDMGKIQPPKRSDLNKEALNQNISSWLQPPAPEKQADAPAEAPQETAAASAPPDTEDSPTES